MNPQADIIAWRRMAPWADDGMVEQDLVLARALVEIFSDAALAQALAVRGGTALHKVVLAPPSRYSEDLDLVQVEAGPIGAVLDRLRARLDPWLGKPTWEQAASTVTLLYRFTSEIPPVRRLRLKAVKGVLVEGDDDVTPPVMKTAGGHKCYATQQDA